MKITIGSRGSKLALAQSEEVKRILEQAYPHLEINIQVIRTKGDRILDKPLNQIGDKGLFTQEIETALLNGTIDLAVHSMKDMPSSLPAGLVFAGTFQPEDARDCLVFNHGYQKLEDLPLGAVVGTGSPRRKFQLLKLRPDLKIAGIRGNVPTRIEKMKKENMDAIVLASAGLKRLGMANYIGQTFDFEAMVPACAQGILALEAKEGAEILSLIQKIEDQQGTYRLTLERLYLETIGGSCHLPIGAHVTPIADGIIFDALLGDEQGTILSKRHEVIHQHIEKTIQKIALEMKAEVEANG